ncbi:MAG: hypothetical protein L0Y71_23050 [Gemmataceae bacterium]|nr:hypothetical protein [Gemmataceae bacterium]
MSLFRSLLHSWNNRSARQAPTAAGRAGRRRLEMEELESRELLSILISPVRGLQTSERGGFNVVTVAMTAAPSADVTIPLTSSRPKEGQVSVSSLTFTPANWNVPQQFRVTGQEDCVKDGNQSYSVITGPAQSADPAHNGINIPDVSLRNLDSRRVAGITVRPASGLVTNEFGKSATFTIKLNCPPRADVLIPLRSSKISEGVVSPGFVTFTPANWNVPQTVTVTGVDELRMDGNVSYKIITRPAISADGHYRGLNAVDVSVTNRDNDQIARFDGTYRGSYTGRVTGFGVVRQISGPVVFTVRRGVITVTNPPGGTGVVSQNGAANFESGSGSVQGAKFGGVFTISGGRARASGGWSFLDSGVSGHGPWQASR